MTEQNKGPSLPNWLNVLIVFIVVFMIGYFFVDWRPRETSIPIVDNNNKNDINHIYEQWAKPIENMDELKKSHSEIYWDVLTAGAAGPAIETVKLLNLKTTRTGKRLVTELKKNYQIKTEPFRWDIGAEWLPDQVHLTTACVTLAAEFNSVTNLPDYDVVCYKLDLNSGQIDADPNTPLAQVYLDL